LAERFIAMRMVAAVIVHGKKHRSTHKQWWK